MALVKNPAAHAASKHDRSIAGRVAIEAVTPQIDCGRFPVKRVLGQPLVIEADVFSDGHDVIDCDLLWRRVGALTWTRIPMRHFENDRWRAAFCPDDIGRYEYTIQAWRDPFASWASDLRKRHAAGQNVETDIAVGERLLSAARPGAHAHRITTALDGAPASERPDVLLSDMARHMMRECGPREGVSTLLAPLPLVVDRVRALFSSWYELFPRSASNELNRHGTFEDVINRLDYVRDLGFDVLYLTPIHPIGATNRKGRNNSLKAEAGDPGSVYAIGAREGGHMALHPELGDFDGFRRLVEAARTLGIELALDIAIQCSPDHPWIKDHPEWFPWRPDGTLRFAENPPKKYEDIVNLRFDGDAYPDVWQALRDVILFWCEHDIRIFRIDNPHTKPLPFWEWMIREVNAIYPDAYFLSEAFTRPKMMKRLAKLGFQQSYTYFTWRNAKTELIDYITELTGEMSDYYRPNFFVNTPDINPTYLQNSGRPGFIVRATLAATLSSSWGIYSGFELCESAALPGREEYLDSEKYEIRARDYDAPGNIKDHIRRLNALRKTHPSLQDFRNVLFLNAWNDNVIAYTRLTEDRRDVIMVMVNLDPFSRQECAYEAPLWEFGLPDHGSIEVEDLLLGGRFTLFGKTHHIALDPAYNPVIIWRLIGPARSGDGA